MQFQQNSAPATRTQAISSLMRIGQNPAKEATETGTIGRHRVIVPVYIPHFQGYFAHALEVLKLCLESLRLSSANQAAITVVSNGCEPTVINELEKYFHSGWIDRLVLNRENAGKVDAVVAVARGCFEPLITITDCDVLFRANWLEAVDALFNAFPECGFVSPFPNPTLEWYHTSTTILGSLLSGELRFNRRDDYTDLERFAQSIERENMYLPEHRQGQMSVQRNGQLAHIGAGHFMCTMRREVLAGMPLEPSRTSIGGASEQRWFDEPPDRLGLWRLATVKAYVSHMGNTPEPWMYDELAALRETAPLARPAPAPLPALTPARLRFIPIGLRNRFLRALRKVRLRQWLARRHLGAPLAAPVSTSIGKNAS